jgi:hypothetical protein
MCDISKTTDLKEAVIYKLCVPLGRDDIQSYFAKTVIKVGPVSGWIYGKLYDPDGLIYSPHMVDRTAGFVDLEDAVKLRKEQLDLLGFHSSVIVELHVVDMPDLPIMQGTGANIIMDSGLDSYISPYARTAFAVGKVQPLARSDAFRRVTSGRTASPGA